MDYRIKRITPWIHIYTIAKLLGIVLFVLSIKGMIPAKGLGPGSYYVAIATLIFGSHLAITIGDFLVTLLSILCDLWLLALPICLVIFYIRFLRKDSVKPYFVLVGIDVLFVLVAFLYALWNGGWPNTFYFNLDTFGTIAVAVGMAVSYLRSAL